MNVSSIGKGAVRDLIDKRDFIYEDIFGSPILEKEVWEQGHDVEKEFDVSLKIENQGSSSSCTGQAVSKLFELKSVEKFGKIAGVDRSAKFIYANVSLGYGVGARPRDAIKFAADMGCGLEFDVPSYENGKPPTEDFMLKKGDITPAAYKEAKMVDFFNYRMIEGIDIDTFAHAIKENKGVVVGFIGSNKGWSEGVVRPPNIGETAWGHLVIATRFGKDDKGKWIGGPNSWGDKWGDHGYWKAYENDYFLRSGFIFNPWVLVWDSLIPLDKITADFIKRNENKLVQNSQTGAVGLIKGGKLLETTSDRAGLLALTMFLRNGYGSGVSDELYNKLPKETF